MTDVLPRPTTTTGAGLVLTDLLTDLVETTNRLVTSLAAGEVLDSYLLAAAAVQIVEDDLQRDWLSLRRGAAYAATRSVPAGIPRALAGAATGCEWLRAFSLEHRRTVQWRWHATRLRDHLARRVIAALARRAAAPGEQPAPAEQPATEPSAESGAAEDRVTAEVGAQWLRDHLPGLPRRVRDALLRLPSCFRSFDQHPLDMVELAARYARRHPRQDAPVLVLGVRTSGAYLAPLVAAALQSRGHVEVYADTARPEFPILPSVRARVRSVTNRGGRVVVVDDPPATGSAIRSVAAAAARCGTGPGAVTLAVPLFADELPERLRRYDSVLLRYSEWSIHPRLGIESIRRMVADIVHEPAITVRALPDATSPDARGHRHAVVEVGWPDGRRRTIVVAGAGLGYFGRHALAIAGALPEALPATYAFADGLVFREWLPAAGRLASVGTEDVPAVVDYITTRAEALPTAIDRSVSLAGRQPAWEAASRVLEPGFGRLGVLLRPVLIDPLIRRLCVVERPSVVDGATGARHWFRDGPGLRKVDADIRAFANTDLSCYDPVFDLAGIDPGSADADLVAALRAAMPCDDERFLLYELVHLWDQAREGRAVHRAASRAVQRYLAATVLDGLQTNPAGPLCALDLDGVLEADSLGFPMITPTGATALRALIAHGYRPVLVTGRSLSEVAERCASYGLLGGVAEYGAVAYDHHTGVVRELSTAADARLLAEVRAAVLEVAGAELDPDYLRIARAFRIDSTGRRRRVPTAVVREILARLDPDGSRLRVVRGDGQTDFVPAGVDKGSGLAALAELIGGASADHAPLNGAQACAGNGVSAAGAPRTSADANAAGGRAASGLAEFSPTTEFSPTAEFSSTAEFSPAAGFSSAADVSGVAEHSRLAQFAGGVEIAFAVGDAEPDLPMLALARHAFAPANADAAVRAAGITLGRQGFAAGLADGVGRLLGHRPGGCPLCAVRELSARERALWTLLDAQRAGAAGLPGVVLRGWRELTRGNP